MSYKLLLHSARQVVMVTKNREKVVYGSGMRNVEVMEARDGQGLSVLVDSDGIVADIGFDDAIKKKHGDISCNEIIDVSGKCILPGLVDGHTHPVWAGDRVHEFSMKLAGASYMEVHKAGGGINFTVQKTRDASEDELCESLKDRLYQMLKNGTTLVECKSGYGLNLETELKMLRAIEKAREALPLSISSTYCGAHAVPKGSTAEDATTDVIEVQLPAIVKEMEANRLHVDNIDVFCEQGVFSVDQSRKVLLEGKKAGMQVNFHAEELHYIGGAEMGCDIGATAMSHLEEISDSGINKMAESKVVAVILPTTAYILRLTPPPVRRMIDAGVPIALGSDFNPNAFCLSMPLVMHLACVTMRMSMEEALVASTINAAASVGKSDKYGSLEVGKIADIIVVDAPR